MSSARHRVVWLMLSRTPKSISQIASGLRKDEFTEASTSGFIIERCTRSAIDARYVEKHVRLVSEKDPFDNLIEFERVEYTQTQFVLSSDSVLLEIHKPPRSVGPTLNALMQHLPGVTIEPVEIDVKRWLRSTQGRIGRARVVGMLITQVSLNHSTRAQVVVKGSDDVARAAESLLQQRKHRIERLDCEVSTDAGPIKVHVFQTGKLALSKENEEILGGFREGLGNALGKGR